MNLKTDKRIEGYELSRWTKDDLVDLLEVYPNLFDMSQDELRVLVFNMYQDAQYHVDRANRLESDASAIEKLMKAKFGNNTEREDK